MQGVPRNARLLDQVEGRYEPLEEHRWWERLWIPGPPRANDFPKVEPGTPLRASVYDGKASEGRGYRVLTEWLVLEVDQSYSGSCPRKVWRATARNLGTFERVSLPEIRSWLRAEKMDSAP